jgi:hypothetical protein
MSSQFRFKPDKIKYLSTIDTLDSSHKQIVNTINKKREDVPLKEKQLNSLKNDLKKLDLRNSHIDDYIGARAKLVEEIALLTDEIEKAENYEDELEYYEKTHEILFNYYDIVDGHKIINKISPITVEEKKEIIEPKVIVEKITDNNSVNKTNDWIIDDIEIFKKNNEPSTLDLLNQFSKMKRKEKNTTKKRVKNVETLIKENNVNDIYNYLDGNKTTDITNNISTEIKYDRASLFKDYKILLEGHPTQKKINKPCRNCVPPVDKVLMHYEGNYVCLVCGDVEKCIIENENSNYKDPMIEKPTFPYKRKNHFCEWMKIYCLILLITARKSRYQISASHRYI